MKFDFSAEMPNNALTKIILFFDGTKLIIDATYFEKDIPKSKVSTELEPNKIIELYGAIDSVLCGIDNTLTVPVEETKHGISFQVHDGQSTAQRKVFNFRIEDFIKGQFVQLIDRGACFSSLRLYLNFVASRIL